MGHPLGTAIGRCNAFAHPTNAAIAPSQQKGRPIRIAQKLVWPGLALLFLGLAVLVPVNHDESQYLAATFLASTDRPFADFIYLQTPLQPILTAPIAELFAGHAFIALRLFTATAAVATLALVFACLRRLELGERVALAVTLLLALDNCFQFGATIFRNDQLPALMLAAGLYAALRAIEGRHAWVLWMLSGLLFGAAAGTKISYALPALAVGAFHAVEVWSKRDRAAVMNALSCAAGAAISAIPAALIYLRAPEAFIYGVFDYAAQAPFDWYRLNGREHRLRLDWKLLNTLAALFRGTAGIALLFVAYAWIRQRKRSSAYLLLDLLIVAGLVAALLPTPTWRQYMIPLLPPLFVRLGLAWRDAALTPRRCKVAVNAFAIMGAFGLVQSSQWIVKAAQGEDNPIVMTRQADWIGDRLKAARARGKIVTLAPQAVIDSGFALDRRFSAGPFAYRSGDLLSERDLRRFHGISPNTLERFLDEHPPAAIVTGYEGAKHSGRVDLDARFRAYALRRGYRLERSPVGEAELFVR